MRFGYTADPIQAINAYVSKALAGAGSKHGDYVDFTDARANLIRARELGSEFGVPVPMQPLHGT